MPKPRTPNKKRNQDPKMFLGGKHGVSESVREFNRSYRAARTHGYDRQQALGMAAFEPVFARGIAPVFGVDKKGEFERLGEKRSRKAARKILVRKVKKLISKGIQRVKQNFH